MFLWTNGVDIDGTNDINDDNNDGGDDADIGEGQDLIDEEEVDRLRPGNI